MFVPLSFIISLLLTNLEGNLKSVSSESPHHKNGGIIVVGSYVSKSSQQLQKLLEKMDIHRLEIDVGELLQYFKAERLNHSSSSSTSSHYDTEKDFCRIIHQNPSISDIFQKYLSIITETIFPSEEFSSSAASSSTKDIVMFTSRTFIKDSELIDLKFISYFITQLIYELKEKPRFLIAKGGITSHEVAQYGLGIRSAKVLGQIEKGVPVWQIDKQSYFAHDDDQEERKENLSKQNEEEECEEDCGKATDKIKEKFADLLYIVFPGNVGDEMTLCHVANKLGVKYKSEESEMIVTASENTSFIFKKDFSLKKTLTTMKETKQAIAAFNICELVSSSSFFLFLTIFSPFGGC
jgi:hypothetical protein